MGVSRKRLELARSVALNHDTFVLNGSGLYMLEYLDSDDIVGIPTRVSPQEMFAIISSGYEGTYVTCPGFHELEKWLPQQFDRIALGIIDKVEPDEEPLLGALSAQRAVNGLRNLTQASQENV